MQIFSLPEATMEKINYLLSCQCSSPEELMAVLWRTEAIFTKQNFLTILAYLLNYDLLVELVLSGLSGALPFDRWLVENFPATLAEYSSSIFPKIIARISNILNSEDFSPSDWSIDQLQIYHRQQEATIPVFCILSELKFDSSRAGKHGKPALKNVRRDRRNSVASQDPTSEMLEHFSLTVPSTAEERDDAFATVIGQMKQALKYYLKTLSASHSQQAIMALFLSTQASTKSKESGSAGGPVRAEHSDTMGFSLADRLQGFGEWKILVSTRAERNLRDAHRKSPTTFNIVMKKIRELSQGYFTDDNQKRLSGPDADIPIFEAKMARDTRLIYQIHCEYDYDTKVEEQVIRIFGVYNHAKMDKRLWDSIGRQLGSHGPEYRQRCLFRLPKNTGFGDSVFVPASFPSFGQTQAPQASSGPELPSEDLEGVHSILVLEKYMIMSKGLLESILADLNVTFPFHLSPQEREIVEYNGSSYILGRSGTGKTTCMLHKIIWKEMLHRMHPDEIAKPRQLFVTKSGNLVKSVREEYEKLSVSFQFSHPMTEHLQLSDLAGVLSEGPKSRKSLPSKFSELEENHFPLFISYDQLLQLIEGDHDISFEKRWGMGRPLLSFSKFRNQYWPRLSRATGLGEWMDPNLVFNEIIGVIEGSEQSLTCDHYFLDRASYQDLSVRTNPTFAGQRDELYTLFEAYQRCKREFGDNDTAERTHTLLQKLYTDNMKGKRIDYLYVDEAQDNLLIDALVLRSFCHNANGLFWAGDTAQTILAGSSFRFEDLKSFLYRIEQKRLDTITPSRKYLSAGSSVPAMFQLTTNYRSHMGITNCAHAVIELLSTFWPETIDALAPEQGVVDGAKPVFLVDWGDNDNTHILSKSSTGAKMELGSNQCILVRNEEAREALRSELQNATIVTTIYDSKGLEFDDVLLLNFFEDSLCDVSTWRLVLNNIEGASYHNCGHRIPVFDPLQHAGLCTELKFLYVAITRARKTVWIADRSEKAGPMRDYWLSRDQIIVSTSNSGLEQLVAFSSPEEWGARGEDFFQRGDFATAKQCFERAGLRHKALESNALSLRELAREIPANFKHRSRQAFSAAANAFLSCADQRNDDSEKSFFVEAARCFALASDWNNAAVNFLKVPDFDSAAQCYLEHEAFGILCNFFRRYRSKISDPMITRIRVAACAYYYRQEDFHNASRFFSSLQEEISFLEHRRWMQSLAGVYERSGQPQKAARIYLEEKQVLRAIPQLLKCQPACTREASRYILNELWKYLSFSKSPVNHPSISSLLSMWEDIDVEQSGNAVQEEFHLLRTVFKSEISALGKIARGYLSKKNIPAALLCFSLYFIDFSSKSNQPGDVARVLHLFHDYTVALTNFTFPGTESVDVDSYPLHFYLFGIRSASPNSLLCLYDTFLYDTETTEDTELMGRQTPEGIEIPRSMLKPRFRQHLNTYLSNHFRQECELFESYLGHHLPCIPRNTLGICHQRRRDEDQQNKDQQSKEPGHQCRPFAPYEWRARVYIVLGHSMVVHHLSGHLGISIAHRKSVCMNLLYQALAILSVSSGEIKALDLIPLMEDGKRLVRYWTSHPEFALDYDNPDILLPWFLRGMKTQILRSDQQPAVNRLQWARLGLACHSPRVSILPSLHGFSWEHLVLDLERLQPDHRINRIETALVGLRLLLDTECQLELDVLCTWLEYLTGLILLKPLWADKPSKQLRVTLPLDTAIQCFNSAPDETDAKRPRQISVLSHLIERVIRLVFSKSMSGRFGFPHNDFSAFPVTDLNVARICRTWCVIGHNHQEFIPGLLATFKSLRNGGYRSPSLAGLYMSISTSQEVLPLIIGTQFSPDQGLVQLCERELGVEDVVPIPGITIWEYHREQLNELFDNLVSTQPKSPFFLDVMKVFMQEASSESPAAQVDSDSFPTLQEAKSRSEARKDKVASGLPAAKSDPPPSHATIQAAQVTVGLLKDQKSSEPPVASDPASIHPASHTAQGAAVEVPKDQVSSNSPVAQGGSTSSGGDPACATPSVQQGKESIKATEA